MRSDNSSNEIASTRLGTVNGIGSPRRCFAESPTFADHSTGENPHNFAALVSLAATGAANRNPASTQMSVERVIDTASYLLDAGMRVYCASTACQWPLRLT